MCINGLDHNSQRLKKNKNPVLIHSSNSSINTFICPQEESKWLGSILLNLVSKGIDFLTINQQMELKSKWRISGKQ